MFVCPVVEAHLEASLKRTFKQYGQIENAAQINDDFRSSPACFVLPNRHEPHGKKVDGGTRHKRAQEFFSVAIVMRAKNAPTKLKTLHSAVYDALQGARLEGTLRPIEFVGARLLQAGDGVIVWQLNFETLFDLGDLS